MLYLDQCPFLLHLGSYPVQTLEFMSFCSENKCLASLFVVPSCIVSCSLVGQLLTFWFGSLIFFSLSFPRPFLPDLTNDLTLLPTEFLYFYNTVFTYNCHPIAVCSRLEIYQMYTRLCAVRTTVLKCTTAFGILHIPKHAENQP